MTETYCQVSVIHTGNPSLLGGCNAKSGNFSPKVPINNVLLEN